jgi:hypothetical protein
MHDTSPVPDLRSRWSRPLLTASPATRLRNALASQCRVRSTGAAHGVSRVVLHTIRKISSYLHQDQAIGGAGALLSLV